MKGTMANSVDTDQTPQNAASDRGIHYLKLIQNFSIKHDNNKNYMKPRVLEMERCKDLRYLVYLA